MKRGFVVNMCPHPGWVAEWFNAAVLKTAEGYAFREFESHPIRSSGMGYLFIYTVCSPIPSSRFKSRWRVYPY